MFYKSNLIAKLINNDKAPFCIKTESNETIEFILNDTLAINQKRYFNDKYCLEMSIDIEKIKDNYVIKPTLKNSSNKISPSIGILEPLSLIFNHNSQNWTHLYANGGTTETYYPPKAYATHEVSRLRHELCIESHSDGRSSNLFFPFLISVANTSDGDFGLFCALEWSAQWNIKVNGMVAGCQPQEKTAISTGIKVDGLKLEGGESLTLPNIHIGFFEGGTNEGTNVLRCHVYDNVCAKYQNKKVIPKVSYDHWFGIGNNYDCKLLKSQAKKAYELGIETFVVDAAWFEGGFPDGVGNWSCIDRNKFPNGIEELSDYVKELGMDFGLWFEVERAMEGSSIIKEHPEYFIPTSAGQHANYYTQKLYHIDFSKKEAQDYVIELLSNLIKTLDIRWSRWDYNIEPIYYFNKLDPSGKIQFDYINGLYRVLDTLMEKHPNWMVESCSSGGRRFDLGTIRRAHTFWFSDETTDPFICRFMQARANRFVPGHLLNSSVPFDLNRNEQKIDDTAMLSRMLGKLALDGNIASCSEEETECIKKWIEIFKKYRHLLVQDFYQLLRTPQTIKDWDAVEFIDYIKKEALVFIFAGEAKSEKIQLLGLDKKKEYKVTCENNNNIFISSGKKMMNNGFDVKLGKNQSFLYHIYEI